MAAVDFQSKGSQAEGKHEFKYAVYFHAADVWRGNVHQKSEEHMLPLKGVQSYRRNSNGLPPELSFIKFDNDDISLSSIKRSDTGDATVIRIYNNTEADIDTTLRTW